MKKLIEIVQIMTVFTALYFIVDYMMGLISINTSTEVNLSILINYGFLIGYVFFIIFIVVMQSDNYSEIRVSMPKTGKIMLLTYMTIAFGFLVYPLFNFDIKFSFFMVMIFMIITSLFGLARQRFMDGKQDKTLHHKKIV
ncbi:MAG: hypothetical protein IH571_01260 [Acholeplasmataceae bacterium]|nr:hypothetical protein [Acholeplasmataceae bacterium]